jgi:hypothetical protein
MEEGIEVVWICPLEPVKVDRRIATGDLRDNLKRRVRWEPGCEGLWTASWMNESLLEVQEL